MKKRLKKKQSRLKPGVFWLGAVIAAALVLVLFMNMNNQFGLDGLAYLEKQSQVEIEDLQKEIAKHRREILVEKIQNGDLDIFSFFSDSVLLGDSRVKAFSEYGYLPESRVMAELGYTILRIPEFLESVEKLQPEYIFLSYGINDLDSGIGLTGEADGYSSLFEENLKALQAASPSSKIIVNSIITVSEPVLSGNPNYQFIQDFNEQIKTMCKKNHWVYLDNSDLDQTVLADYFERDGIHFTARFLPVWAQRMMDAALD